MEYLHQETVNACCHFEALEDALIKAIRGAGPVLKQTGHVMQGWPLRW